MNDMPEIYRHTQIGWVMIGSTLVVLPVIVIGISAQHANLLTVPLCVIALALLLFGTLTVAVDPTRLSLRFGIGVIRKRIALGDIRSFSAVRNPWYWGWGIRFTPVGRLYNVSGLSAVDLLLRSGRHIRVGTDEPDVLVDALRRVLGDPAPLSDDEQRAAAGGVRRVGVIVGLGVLAITTFVLGMFYVGLQPPVIRISPALLSVHDGLYHADVPMSEILEVSLQDTIPRVVRKTNGFDAGNTLRGDFRLEVLGQSRLFINRDVQPYVVIKTRGGFLIVNFKDPQRTRALYDEVMRYKAVGR